MLTELGHGLDIINIETTATFLPTGEFLLHSPTAASAKYDFRDYLNLLSSNVSLPDSCLLQYPQDCRALQHVMHSYTKITITLESFSVIGL